MKVSPKGWAWIGASGVVLAILGAIMGWLLFPYAVDLVIGKELALKSGSDAWNRFVDLPLALDMELRIFNVTNVAAVMKGAKPQLQELGPYVYKQHRHKVDVKYNENNDTITYKQLLLHYFDETASGQFRSDDVVTVVNPALLSFMAIMENSVLSPGIGTVDQAAPLLFPDGLFVTSTADELLFRGVRIPCSKIEAEQARLTGQLTMSGIAALFMSQPRKGSGLPSPPSPRLSALIVCSALKHIKVPAVTVLDDGDVAFSVFGYKNNTADGVYTVRAGNTNPAELAQITAWQGKAHVDAWSGPTCNAINGTQGDIFSPYITRQSTISVFSTDICRSMALDYMEDTTYMGIAGYRFVPGPDIMADARDNGNNYCFCPRSANGLTKPNGCLRAGAIDLSSCQGIPVIVTYPHFYMGDPSYLDGVEGLNPQAELHRMQVDIEPMTGTPLLGGKKMQLNMQIKEIAGVELTKGVRDTLVPVAWMYEGAKLNQELLDLLNNMLLSKLDILAGIKYAMLALGVLMSVAGATTFVVLRRRKLAVRPHLLEDPPQRPPQSSDHHHAGDGKGAPASALPPGSDSDREAGEALDGRAGLIAVVAEPATAEAKLWPGANGVSGDAPS